MMIIPFRIMHHIHRIPPGSRFYPSPSLFSKGNSLQQLITLVMMSYGCQPEREPARFKKTGQRSKNDTQSVTTFVEMVNCVLCVWSSLMGNFLSFPAYFLSYHYKSHYTSLLAIIIIIIIIHWYWTHALPDFVFRVSFVAAAAAFLFPVSVVSNI